MKTVNLLLAGLSLLCAAGGSNAMAQEDLPDCASDAACLALFDQAKEQSTTGKLEEALRLYRLAYEVRADPRLLFNIARVLHKQGNTSEAVHYYRKFLASPISDDEQKKRTSEYLEQILSPTPAVPPNNSIGSGTNPSGSAPIAVTVPTTRAHKYYKFGWIASVTVAGTLVAASIPFWYFSTLEGPTACGANVARNQCPQIYQGGAEIAAPLLAVGLAHVIPFGILLYFDRK